VITGPIRAGDLVTASLDRRPTRRQIIAALRAAFPDEKIGRNHPRVLEALRARSR